MLPVDYVPAFEDNYIWLIHDEPRRHAVLVDPGEAEPVIERLEASGSRLLAILLTHHHGDHTGGVEELVAHYGAAVIAPEDPRIPAVSRRVGDGDLVEVAELGLRLEVLELPGHTRSHIAFYGHGALFCGDTLFTAGCGRLFEGTPVQMQASLARLRALPDETLVYCAHEYTLDNLRFARVVEPESPALAEREAQDRARRADGLPTVPSRLELEKRTNPFLRFDVEPVVRAAEAYAGRKLDTPAEVFAAVREWKDELD